MKSKCFVVIASVQIAASLGVLAQHAVAVVAKRQVAIAAIRSKFQPEIVAQLDGVRNEISEVLTAPQRVQWTQLFDQFKERWLPAAPPIDNR